MTPSRTGSLRLVRFAGINVFVHWSWLVVAAIEIKSRAGSFRSLFWNVLEYLTLFSVVLLHEFGHALACRQVGGQADEIVLWPLGGVAYVTPPARPGPTLWSIAAGPLVNLVLLALTAGVLALLPDGNSDGRLFLRNFAVINFVLLGFNILPIYPLDGGQILRALLWFLIGRARSLMVAAGVGLVAVLGLLALAAAWGSLWLGLLGVFALMSCWRGLGRARVLARLAQLPRHQGFACPACKSAPPIAELWRCSLCGLVFDTFATRAVCPNCGNTGETTACPDCGRANPIARWSTATSDTPGSPVVPA
jgi:Zn-dependent protease/rubredoxin